MYASSGCAGAVKGAYPVRLERKLTIRKTAGIKNVFLTAAVVVE